MRPLSARRELWTALRRLRRQPKTTGHAEAAEGTGRTLAAAVQAVGGWRLRPAEWMMLADLEREIRQRPGARVAMLRGDHASPLRRVLEARFADIRVYPADLRAAPDDLHAALATHGPYDLIIDDSRRVYVRRRVFRNSWYHLVPGGLYVIRDFRKNPWPEGHRPVDTAVWPYLQRLIERRAADDPTRPTMARSDRRFVEAIGRIRLGAEHLIVQNRGSGYAKMREASMNLVIDNRDDDRAQLVDVLPVQTFTSRARLDRTDLLADKNRYRTSYEPPEMSVRRYRDAVVLPRQIALLGNLVLPETFRHNQYPTLTHHGMEDLGRYFADVATPDELPLLPGRYFYLDAEWRQHFGHLLTEQLSRLWAWPGLKARFPDLKAVLSLQRGHDRPHPWELEIFSAAGIAPEDLTVIDRPVRVDELFGATPMFSMPSYVDPRIVDLWNRVGHRLTELEPPSRHRLRVFITRPADSTERPCHNQGEVEDYFRDRGFTVVHPELLPVGEQVSIFRNADVIAGFAGSGMFNLMFRTEPVPVILIRSAAYTAVNEYMISSVRGNTLSVVDGVPDLAHPPGRWSRRAFHAGFRVDFHRVGRDLDRAVDEAYRVAATSTRNPPPER